MSLTNYNVKSNEFHPFHLVKPSPWPFMTALATTLFLLSFVLYMHHISPGSLLISNPSIAGPIDSFFRIMGIILLPLVVAAWFRDVHLEAITGNHTREVQNGLRYGMILFIVSEIMFFFAFFWAFFHASLSPSIAIGCVWPPQGIKAFNPWGLPLLNTVILLSSGISVTWAHRAIIAGQRENTIIALIITVALGAIFTACQLYEYSSAPFSINDGIYGSVFYMATGFHGFHVLIGTILLLVSLVRHINYHFTQSHHVGFEAAAWYWHFVDVVWIFLYIWVYCWGS